MKPRHLLMLIGLAVAAWLALFGDKTPSGGIAAPVTRATENRSTDAQRAETIANRADGAAHAAESGPKPKHKADITILALRDRAELIGGASSGDNGNLFGQQSWAPPPPPPAKPAPPQPPTAPTLPFTYLGKKNEDAAWEVYLAHGDTTLIVHENTVIEGTYRVDSISPPMLHLTYLPLNQGQDLPIGDAE